MPPEIWKISPPAADELWIHPVFVQLPEGATAPASSEGHVYDGGIERGMWVDAANLKPGYRLLNDDGSWATVVKLSSQPTPLKAYNLKVSDFHTYFVTGNARAEPVWVHNTCDIDDFARRLRETPQVERRAFITNAAQESAGALGFVRVPPSIARRNGGRTIYTDPATGYYYSVDFAHGGFERFSLSGVHQGEIRFDGTARGTAAKPNTHRINL